MAKCSLKKRKKKNAIQIHNKHPKRQSQKNAKVYGAEKNLEMMNLKALKKRLSRNIKSLKIYAVREMKFD